MKTYALIFLAMLISLPSLIKAQTKTPPPFQATNFLFFENDNQQASKLLSGNGLSQFRVQFNIEGDSDAEQGEQTLYFSQLHQAREEDRRMEAV